MEDQKDLCADVMKQDSLDNFVCQELELKKTKANKQTKNKFAYSGGSESNM